MRSRFPRRHYVLLSGAQYPRTLHEYVGVLASWWHLRDCVVDPTVSPAFVDVPER